MATVDSVLEAARGELGYEALRDPEPGSRYGRWMAELTGEDWLAGPSREIWWCCMFVSWCLDQAGQECPGFPSYNTDLVLAAEPPRVPVSAMRPGDIVIWDWDGNHTTDHIGFVESCEDGRLTTIEGNYRNTVARVDRTSAMPLVSAVIRPPYAAKALDLRRGIDIYNGEGGAGMQGDETDAAFVICKASEGTGFADPYAAKFAANVTDAGKLLGFYHFARRGDAEAQAEHFVACCKATGHLAEATLWLDYEADAVANGPAWGERFMRRVDEMTGKTCGVYMSQNVTVTQDWSASASRPLWVAQYAGTHAEGPVTGWQDDPWTVGVFGAWGGSCAVHQYTGRGHVPGWSGYLDLDRGHFTADEWAAWAGSAPGPEPTGIEEDGYWGRETTAAAQRAYGTPEDGEVWHQWPSTAQPGCTGGWVYDRTGAGSALIRAMQADLADRGLYKGPVDGLAGPLFWRAFQTDMGTPADGEIWAPSPAVLEFQRRLNGKGA